MIYDRFAAGYDLLLAPLEKRFLSSWRSETLALLPRGARLLEIGAGTGLNFRHYPPCEVAAASDVSREMLSRSRGRTDSIELVQADAQRLPFGEDSFDAAFGTLVFCSIPDPMLAFEELRRVVACGGRIVLLEHVRPSGFLGGCFDLLSVATVALIDDHFNRETAALASASGLRVIEVRRKAGGVVNLIVCENAK